jgi:hypothetical protein
MRRAPVKLVSPFGCDTSLQMKGSVQRGLDMSLLCGPYMIIDHESPD